MQLLNKQETLDKKREIILAIKAGKIFIYPTDTIYGLGCDATNDFSVEKIRNIKKREEKPFSVIAPNKDWIKNNCKIGNKNNLDVLPGPYTLILNKIVKDCVSKNVSYSDTLGVRIPENWFCDLVRKSRRPFVTTSVNLSGEPHMQKIDDLKEEIKKSVDYIIYNGPIMGESSQKVDLTGK